MRAIILILLAVAAGCGARNASGPAEDAPVRLRLATTTSVDSTGLLAELLPPFEKANNVKVDVIAVGTGKAIKLCETGDADVLLAHDPEAEESFVARGFGFERRAVMRNDFVLVGPPDDPAGASGAETAAGAFKAVASSKAPFISRGDISGTHMKEMRTWKAAGVSPSGSWYMEAGQGMMPVLLMAAEKSAYCLCDRATWLAFERMENLKIVFQGDPALFNPYSVIAVNPAKHAHVRHAEAMKLIEWLTSVEGRKIIGGFRKHGEILFRPESESSAGGKPGH